jgi:hypothetical protein
MNSSGDETTKSFHAAIEALEEQKNSFRHELTETKSTLEITESKLKSLQVSCTSPPCSATHGDGQDILQSLESSQAERIEMEKSAANQRAIQQQERENQHRAEMRELERGHAEAKNQLTVCPCDLGSCSGISLTRSLHSDGNPPTERSEGEDCQRGGE